MLNEQRERLLSHPLLERLTHLGAWRIFMEYHVFAVWDFMSLLKRLQRELTCVEVPWVPRAQGDYARFIHELVLAEESDENGEGGHSSHFELYVGAMRACGANTAPVLRFVDLVRGGMATDAALVASGAPAPAQQFVGHTLNVAQHSRIEEVCSAFFWGREDIIPRMFGEFVATLPQSAALAPLRYYLNRHIELDGDHHGPLAHRMLDALCGEEPARQTRAARAAELALQARWDLWMGVHDAIEAAGCPALSESLATARLNH